jgi:hypothetical protein
MRMMSKRELEIRDGRLIQLGPDGGTMHGRKPEKLTTRSKSQEPVDGIPESQRSYFVDGRDNLWH